MIIHASLGVIKILVSDKYNLFILPLETYKTLSSGGGHLGFQIEK